MIKFGEFIIVQGFPYISACGTESGMSRISLKQKTHDMIPSADRITHDEGTDGSFIDSECGVVKNNYWTAVNAAARRDRHDIPNKFLETIGIRLVRA